MGQKINGVQVFSATMREDRAQLGDKVTAWMARFPNYEIVDMLVTQSSDHAFHCLAITVWFFDPKAAARTIPVTRRAS